MTSILITAPAVEPLAIADLRAHLRVREGVEDGLLESYLKAAREHVERSTGRALIFQSWRLYLDTWPEGRVVRLPVAPVHSVDAVTVYDGDGTARNLTSDKWTLAQGSLPPRVKISLDIGVSCSTMMGAEIEFTAGHGAGPEAVPETCKQAIRLLVAHWYENREEGAKVLSSIPQGVDRLLASMKAPRI